MTLKRLKKPILQNEFGNSTYYPLSSDDFGADSQITYRPVSSRHFHNAIMSVAFCLAIALAGYIGQTFESVAVGKTSLVVGNNLLKGTTHHENKTTDGDNLLLGVMAADPTAISGSNATTVDTVDKSHPIVHEAKQFEKQKRILALGGSTTWGEKLENRHHNYPAALAHLLGVHWGAVTIAARSTDSSFASQCVESMIRQASPSIDDMVKDYDVILLEYSLSGLDNFHLLARRLRRRYPNAMIIYVHLWSLRMTLENSETGEKPRTFLHERPLEEAEGLMSAMIEDTSIPWKYSDEMVSAAAINRQASLDAVQHVEGYLYDFPIPTTPQEALAMGLFSNDHHHLSKNGHKFVAQELFNLMHAPEVKRSPSDQFVQHFDHSWGKGDQCFSWFETGKSPLVEFRGGTMTMFSKPNKWALQVGDGFGRPATILFENAKIEPQPVRIQVMSWGPGTYPKAKIQLNAPGQKPDGNAILLDPLHPFESQRIFHIPISVHIGWVNSGKNSVTIDSMETKEHPFRVTGIVMCGACVEMDNVYLKAGKLPDRDPKVPDEEISEQAPAEEEIITEDPPNGPQQDSALNGDFSGNPSEIFAHGTIALEHHDETIEHLQLVQAVHDNSTHVPEAGEPNQSPEENNVQIESTENTMVRRRKI